MRLPATILCVCITVAAFGCDRPGAFEKMLPREIDRRLLRAALKGDTKEMDAAVKDGADPNASAKLGMSVLKMTYACRNKVGFEHLLELGADPHHADSNGSRVIHFVAHNMEDADWIKLVLKHGGDPNITSPVKDRPDTPLFYACFAKNLDSVKALVAGGANMNALGTRGRSVVIASSHQGSPIVTKWLLENGADWTARDVEGTSVAEAELHREYDPATEPELAVAHDWILKFLTDKGVDMKAAEEKSRELYQKNFRAKRGEIKVFDKLPEGIQAR
jgi:ankyrin repeat protein